MTKKTNTKQKLYEMFEKINKVNLREWYDDDDYGIAPKPLQGIGKFENIDWRVLFDTLVDNDNKINGESDSIGANVGDLTDYDGLLSNDELNKLIDFGIIEIVNSFPILDESITDFNVFYNKSKEIWNKEMPYQQNNNDNESPFLRGREPES